MRYENVKRGADPELFLVRNGTLLSAIGRIGGTKKNPKPILGIPGYAVQEDNVAVEFNIPPCDSLEKFRDAIGISLEYLSETFREQNILLYPIPSARFSADQLADPKAQEFGCDPDFCVWTQDQNVPPDCDDLSLRSAGGHMHLSWDGNKSVESVERLVKAHDLFCGLWSVITDEDQERRKLYGRAGAFRFKDYGMEYRTMSNFWISSPYLVEEAYRKSEQAVAFANSDQEISWDLGCVIQEAINNSNKELAASILNGV